MEILAQSSVSQTIQSNEPNLRKRSFSYSRLLNYDPTSKTLGARLTYDQYFIVYQSNTDLSAVLDRLGIDTGNAGHDFVNESDPSAKVPEKVYRDVNSILNYYEPFRETVKTIVRDTGLTGDAYLEIVRSLGGAVVGLAYIDPRSISIVSDRHGNIIRYLQKNKHNQIVEFAPDEIIHIKKGKDPRNSIFGHSPLESLYWEVKTDIAAAKSNYVFFDNNAVPAVVFVLDDDITDEDSLDTAMDGIKKQFSGAENKHKSAILSGIKEIKTISQSHKDMEFVLGRKFTIEKICSRYLVPKFLLGYTESVNNNNGTELMKLYYNGPVRAYENMISDAITTQLLRDVLGIESYKMVFKPQYADMGKVEERALKEKEHGAITLEEYRKKTGQPLSDEQLKENEYADRFISGKGKSSTLLEDTGVDGLTDDLVNGINDGETEGE